MLACQRVSRDRDPYAGWCGTASTSRPPSAVRCDRSRYDRHPRHTVCFPNPDSAAHGAVRCSWSATAGTLVLSWDRGGDDGGGEAMAGRDVPGDILSPTAGTFLPLSLESRHAPPPPPPPPPWCVGVPNADKKDCGFSGSTEPDCLARRCCWDPISPDPDHYPCCFNTTPVPPPPRPPRPPSARPIVKLTIEAANERWFDAVQWLRH